MKPDSINCDPGFLKPVQVGGGVGKDLELERMRRRGEGLSTIQRLRLVIEQLRIFAEERGFTPESEKKD